MFAEASIEGASKVEEDGGKWFASTNMCFKDKANS